MPIDFSLLIQIDKRTCGYHRRKDAKVSKIVLTKDMPREVKDKSYIGKEVCLIDFPISRYPNNTGVYADEVTCTLIGRGIVD
jgi:hypothetical protein